MKTSLFSLLLSVFFVGFTSAQSLRVITYNIRFDNPGDGPNRWELRREYLFSQMRFAEPAVFGIQEGLAHQVRQLDSALVDYDYIGVGRDDGKQQGEFSALFYHKEVVELLDEGTFWLSPTPAVPSKGWDAALPRICTYARFRLKKGGREFLVFNTHFDHVGEQARRESAALILRQIGERNPSKLPVILMGDFNLEPTAEGIAILTEVLTDTHLASAAVTHGPEGTFNAFDVQRTANRRIDFIFASRDSWQVERSLILSDCFEGRFPSDHFPVQVDLYLTPIDR